MAKYHGKTAAASFGSAIEEMIGWSYDLTAATADSTAAHVSNKGRERVVGFFSGTATVNTFANGSSQAATIGQSEELELERVSGTTAVKGQAICTSIEDGAVKDGVLTTNYNFTFTGVVAD